MRVGVKQEFEQDQEISGLRLMMDHALFDLIDPSKIELVFQPAIENFGWGDADPHERQEMLADACRFAAESGCRCLCQY